MIGVSIEPSGMNYISSESRDDLNRIKAEADMLVVCTPRKLERFDTIGPLTSYLNFDVPSICFESAQIEGLGRCYVIGFQDGSCRIFLAGSLTCVMGMCLNESSNEVLSLVDLQRRDKYIRLSRLTGDNSPMHTIPTRDLCCIKNESEEFTIGVAIALADGSVVVWSIPSGNLITRLHSIDFHKSTSVSIQQQLQQNNDNNSYKESISRPHSSSNAAIASKGLFDGGLTPAGHRARLLQEAFAVAKGKVPAVLPVVDSNLISDLHTNYAGNVRRGSQVNSTPGGFLSYCKQDHGLGKSLNSSLNSSGVDLEEIAIITGAHREVTSICFSGVGRGSVWIGRGDGTLVIFDGVRNWFADSVKEETGYLSKTPRPCTVLSALKEFSPGPLSKLVSSSPLLGIVCALLSDGSVGFIDALRFAVLGIRPGFLMNMSPNNYSSPVQSITIVQPMSDLVQSSAPDINCSGGAVLSLDNFSKHTTPTSGSSSIGRRASLTANSAQEASQMLKSSLPLASLLSPAGPVANAPDLLVVGSPDGEVTFHRLSTAPPQPRNFTNQQASSSAPQRMIEIKFARKYVPPHMISSQLNPSPCVCPKRPHCTCFVVLSTPKERTPLRPYELEISSEETPISGSVIFSDKMDRIFVGLRDVTVRSLSGARSLGRVLTGGSWKQDEIAIGATGHLLVGGRELPEEGGDFDDTEALMASTSEIAHTSVNPLKLSTTSVVAGCTDRMPPVATPGRGRPVMASIVSRPFSSQSHQNLQPQHVQNTADYGAQLNSPQFNMNNMFSYRNDEVNPDTRNSDQLSGEELNEELNEIVFNDTVPSLDDNNYERLNLESRERIEKGYYNTNSTPSSMSNHNVIPLKTDHLPDFTKGSIEGSPKENDIDQFLEDLDNLSSSSMMSEDERVKHSMIGNEEYIIKKDVEETGEEQPTDNRDRTVLDVHEPSLAITKDDENDNEKYDMDLQNQSSNANQQVIEVHASTSDSLPIHVPSQSISLMSNGAEVEEINLEQILEGL